MGNGKDETLGDKLRVAVIATGFNNNRGRATAATEQKIETATTTSAKKPYFKVEPLPDDLEMKVMNPAELEEEARLRRQKQEEERARKQKRESNRRVDVLSGASGESMKCPIRTDGSNERSVRFLVMKNKQINE